MKTKWLYPRHIAAFLGISRPTAVRLLRRIPGAELMYQYERRNGERWRVSLERYREWRRSLRGGDRFMLDNQQKIS